MTDLLELGGFYGDLAGEQVMHSPRSPCDFATLRDTLFFSHAKTLRREGRKIGHDEISCSSVAFAGTLPVSWPCIALVLLATLRLCVRHCFLSHAKTLRRKGRKIGHDEISSSSVASMKTLPASKSCIALVFLAPLRLCVKHFHFTQRR